MKNCHVRTGIEVGRGLFFYHFVQNLSHCLMSNYSYIFGDRRSLVGWLITACLILDKSYDLSGILL